MPRRAAQQRNPKPRTKEDSTMNVFVIIALVCIVALAWLWPRKSGLKRTTVRNWPAARGKMGAKPKLTTP
jgi:hypothetical protein